MRIIDRKLGCILLQSDLIHDSRGWFSAAFCMSDMKRLDIKFEYAEQLNHSYTEKAGVIRGLNYQCNPYEQAKLIRCVKGSLYSVGADITCGSAAFGKWCGYELNADDGLMMYVPRGYAHGFVTMENYTELEYITDNIYSFEHAKSVRFDDRTIGIDWTVGGTVKLQTGIMSDKNKNGSYLEEIRNGFKA